jgi:hypothetical protein
MASNTAMSSSNTKTRFVIWLGRLNGKSTACSNKYQLGNYLISMMLLLVLEDEEGESTAIKGLLEVKTSHSVRKDKTGETP